MHTARHPLQTGVSLVEALTVLAVLGILWALAGPGLAGLAQRQRLQGVGESFRSDFQQARMQAMGTGRSVRISFSNSEAGSCYIVYQGDIGSCACGDDGAAQCAQPEQLLIQHWVPKSRGVRIEANVVNMTIDGHIGTVTPTATVRLRSDQGSQLAQVVALTGRVRTCGDADLHLQPCRI